MKIDTGKVSFAKVLGGTSVSYDTLIAMSYLSVALFAALTAAVAGALSLTQFETSSILSPYN